MKKHTKKASKKSAVKSEKKSAAKTAKKSITKTASVKQPQKNLILGFYRAGTGTGELAAALAGGKAVSKEHLEKIGKKFKVKGMARVYGISRNLKAQGTGRLEITADKVRYIAGKVGKKSSKGKAA